VPPDLLRRAQQHDAQRVAGPVVELRSHMPIEQQVRATGATWLDRGLVVANAKGQQPAVQGFGAQVRGAVAQRLDFLVEHGLAERQGQRVILVRNLLTTLRDRDLFAAGKTMQQQTGLTYRSTQDGEHVGGVYRRSVDLASGRYALLDGRSFSLVPWRRVRASRRLFGRRCHLDARAGTGTRYSLISRGPYPSAISSPTEDLAGRLQTYAHAR